MKTKKHTQQGKPILSVFASYCDCYIYFINNYITLECFCEDTDVCLEEMTDLLDTVYKLSKDEKTRYESYRTLDYYMNRKNNGDKIISE